MRDVAGLLLVLLALPAGRAGEIEPSGGYCIANQCFTLFRDPSDHKTAQDHCRDQGGRLMTVRTSLSHDVVFILLATVTGRFWIGLHRAADCPDPASELRGFQWGAGDDESDFSNWATTFDGSCSSHRCVSVSEEDFKWTQEPCDRRADGFLCEHSFSEPCGSLGVSDWETVTYRTPMGFDTWDALSLPPGSTATRIPSETKHICFSERWLEAPWSCEIQDGGCEHRCAVDPHHVPSCYCPPGQTVNPANNVTCDAAPEDPCLLLRCAHACYKNGDSHACMCDRGFKLARDGRSCVDFNDCGDERQCPGENFACVNTVGGFQCVCEEGYQLTGDLCVDVDECVSAPCEHMCANTPGGFECACYDGYKEDPASPNTCKLYCGDEECVAECDPNDPRQCYCPEGYIAEERSAETVCIDIDECAFSYCEQDCDNSFGGYMCSCSPGYTLVSQYRCVKSGGGVTDVDGGGTEGSGAGTTPDALLTSPAPRPGPTRRPNAVTTGGLVGIIVGAVLAVVLVVFLVHRFCGGSGRMGSADARKAPEGEAHRLRHVTSDA